MTKPSHKPFGGHFTSESPSTAAPNEAKPCSLRRSHTPQAERSVPRASADKNDKESSDAYDTESWPREGTATCPKKQWWIDLGISWNGGTQKWMVYHHVKSHLEMDDWGVPPFCWKPQYSVGTDHEFNLEKCFTNPKPHVGKNCCINIVWFPQVYPFFGGCQEWGRACTTGMSWGMAKTARRVV